MPSYQAALSEEEIWALAHYVSSLNTGVLSQAQVREEQAGQMALRMHGGMGMMRRMPMMR
jgi:mono/diheme cytochrome c family protein